MRGNTVTDRNGSKNPNYKDGRKGTRLYSIYENMLTRCENPKSTGFSRYGGRGISVCEEWHDFKKFHDWAINNGYSDNLTIDRIDNNGNYEPSNCRWVTLKEQANNKNCCHIVKMFGCEKTLMEWCETYNINYKTVRDRLKRGWSYEKAITFPVKTKYGKKVIL